MAENLYEELQQQWEALVSAHQHGSAFHAGKPPGRFALFAELEDVLRLLAELRSSGLENYAERFLMTQWSISDLLAHVGSWAAEFRRQVETIAQGEKFDYAIPFALSVMGPTQWNHDEVQKRRLLQPDAVLVELESEMRRLQDLILTLTQKTLHQEAEFPMAPSGNPAALWKGSIAFMALLMCTHYRMHLERIQQWLLSLPTDAKLETRGSIMIKSGNVTVMVSNMNQAVRFYTEALGLKLRSRYGDEWAEVEAPGVTIGLHPTGKDGPKPGRSENLSIGFTVEKLEPAMDALKAKGVVFSPEIRTDGPIRIAFFTDPDNNPLYLCEVP